MWLDWVLWFRVSHKVAINYWLEPWPSQGLTGGGSPSQPSKISFLPGHWTEGLSSSLAGHWPEAANEPSCRAAYNIKADFHQRNKGMRDQEMASKTEATGFLYLILEEASHHSGCILVFRNESLSLAHTRGEGSTQGHKYKEGRVLGNILEAA